MFHIITYGLRSPAHRRVRKRWLTVAIVLSSAAIVPLLSAAPALGQTPHRQTHLAALRQQNAFQQQQSAVQSAVQQTTLLVQNANQNAVAQSGAPPAIYFQSLENTLQIALQQTSALQQTASRSNTALNHLALRQQNTLQTALQQTIAVETALSSPGSQLNSSQLQLLSQVQNSLTELFATQPRSLQRRNSGR
jgi:hypothetical protein